MISTVTKRREEYVGDGSDLIFPYTHRADDESWFVIWVNRGTGAAPNWVLQVLTTDYTATGIGVDAGGNIVFVVAPPDPLDGSVSVVVLYGTPHSQLEQLQEGGVGYQRMERNIADKLTMEIQDNCERIGRCLKVPPWSTMNDFIVERLAFETGVVEMAGAEVTVTVTFQETAVDTDYTPMLLGTTWLTTQIWSNRTINGFDVTFGTPPTAGDFMSWGRSA